MVPLTCTMPICSLCREGWLRTRRPALSLDTNLRTWEKQRGDGDREPQEQRTERNKDNKWSRRREKRKQKVDGGRSHALTHSEPSSMYTHPQSKRWGNFRCSILNKLDEACFSAAFFIYFAWQTMVYTVRGDIHSANAYIVACFPIIDQNLNCNNFHKQWWLQLVKY